MDNKIPDKIKDQHIIVDKSIISKIANAASLTEHDSVLDVLAIVYCFALSTIM